MSDELRFPVPNRFRRGAYGGRKLVETGREIFDLVLTDAGLDSFEGLDILDFGSGYRMAQVLMEYDLPFGSYWGVDLDPEMIGWLQGHRPDPRINFGLVPFQNEMYRPDGEPMTAAAELPVDGARFDVIMMFSVVTHLTPDDTRALLSILRRYLAPGGFLYFSAFVNPFLEVPFQDQNPDEPLRFAVYAEQTLFDLLAETGWAAERYEAPVEQLIKYRFLCRPSDDPNPPRPPGILERL
ncbi:MAG: hypothetical protein DHS20C19_09660 [Acidimicrobiales bacterium]|nr:MAG: hypothetical protein DHS20C19_09660 [Acidimicrobiales bacterium]